MTPENSVRSMPSLPPREMLSPLCREPQRLLVEIYRQKKEREESGLSAARVVLSMLSYRKIRAYHCVLGKLPDHLPDYISKDRIFGLEVYIHDRPSVLVTGE